MTDWHVEKHGEGKPVVCLHGFHIDHHVMKGCLEPIFAERQGYARIYLDLPGMGKTPYDPAIRNTDDMLEAVLRFLDEHLAGQSFLLAGYSYGGYLARGIVQRRMKDVEGLLLLCPMVVPYERDVPAFRTMVENQELLSSLAPQEADDFSGLAVVRTPRVLERFRSDIRPGLEAADPRLVESDFRVRHFGCSHDVDRLDRPFEKPALIVTGRQDAVTGYRDAWRRLENYPRATFIVLDQAGHIAHIEQERVVNPLIHNWLDRVEENLAGL